MTGKLALSTRMAHRAVRLMSTRGQEDVFHYRCYYCTARHITSMPRSQWPDRQPLNSPLVNTLSPEDMDIEGSDPDADAA